MSTIMDVAKAAAERVKSWSPAKQAFANKVVHQGKYVARHLDDDLGIIKSVEWTTDDTGRQVCRATVDYYHGSMPTLPIKAVWEAWPVRIVRETKTA